ncbi:site-specific integrase [Thermanaeromonas toyohensis]|nr:site-specific integrase [Thermanaeromonas toyohensis]
MPTGHLEKRYKSSWTIVIELDRDPVTGKRKRITKSVKGTKKEAEKEMVRMLNELERGTYVEPSGMTVGEYLLHWLEAYCKPNLAPKTLQSYSYIIHQHLIPALGHIKLDKLQPLHLQEYYSKALQSGRKDGKGGLSLRSVQYHHRILHEALGHALKWQLVHRNVAEAVEAPRYKRPDVKALSPEEVNKLLAKAKEINHPDYALLVTAVYTGMRQGELLGLRWQDIDMTAGVAYVRQILQKLPGQPVMFKEPKTQAGKRQVVLSPAVIDILKAAKKQQAENRLRLGQAYQDYGLVFCRENGLPLDPFTVTHRFKKLAKLAGFPELRFHDLRHTHATLLLAQGVHPKVVQERLGHRSITLTLDTYSHVLPTLQKEAAAKVEEALKHSK